MPGLHRNRNDEYYKAVSDIEILYRSSTRNAVYHSNQRITMPLLLHPL